MIKPLIAAIALFAMAGLPVAQAQDSKAAAPAKKAPAKKAAAKKAPAKKAAVKKAPARKK